MSLMIEPPSNYLAYRPSKGRYQMFGVWGYAFEPDQLLVRFTIVDTVTGDEVWHFKKRRRKRAEADYPLLVRVVKAWNAGNPAWLALTVEAESGSEMCKQGHLWRDHVRQKGGKPVCWACVLVNQRRMRHARREASVSLSDG